MGENQNEFSKFLEDVKEVQPQSIDEALGLTKEVPAEKQDASEMPEKADEPRKNRHHRRLEAQLQSEREARIRAEALLEARAERAAEVAGDIDPRLLQLYGSEERGKEAAALTQQLLQDYAKKAQEAALNDFEARQAAKDAELDQFEQYLDSEFEALEDQYNVDLTSNAPAARKARNEMLELLEQISPKDADGNITSYADMNGLYQMYQLKRSQEKSNPTLERQKSLSALTRTQASNTPPQEKQPTPGFYGWRKDFGL